jgi:hypothetical protein
MNGAANKRARAEAERIAAAAAGNQGGPPDAPPVAPPVAAADVVPVYVADPAANPPVQFTTWQDLIARYQVKFMPPAAGVYSRAEYNIAKQISSEDIGGWHARLHDLYNPAYPGKEVDNNLPLIEKFVTQLINKEVGKFVFERDPATFAGALALAQTKTATNVTFKTPSRASIHAFSNPSSAMADSGVNYSGKGRGSSRGGRGRGGSSRPERREGEAGKSWICDSSSHQKSACPVWDKALTLARKESGGSVVIKLVLAISLRKN